MHARLILLAVAAASFIGCQTASRYQGNEDSPYYVVPVGSRSTLNQPVTIPSGQLAIYIQDGAILRNVDLQHYYPFCRFELKDLSDTARTVAADEMIVTKTVQEEIQGALAHAGLLMVAALSLRINGEPGGPPPIQSFSTRMELRSDKQPEISRLTCSQWGYPGLHRHVTIAEMRKTLSPLFTLRLPGP